MKAIYSSDRKFVMFSYHASHGLILFRSGKSNNCSTRCDVMFHDVRAMELRSTTQGISIFEVDLAYLENFKSQPLDILEEGLTAYKIGNGDWSGFVLGGIVRVAEDSGDFFDRSPLQIPDDFSSKS